MAAEGRDFAPPVSQAGVKKPPPLLPIGCVDALGNGFRDACKRAGIEGLRLQDLRAEAVSRLFERGLTLPEVRAISRHKSSALLRYVRSGDVEALARRLG